MSFVHLHCHTHYSLLDGLPSPEAYLKKAQSYGCPSLAMTDHGNLYGAIEFYQAAKEHDIKPIIGMEAYTAATSRFSKQAGIDNQIGHLLLLARNKKGYENLIALSTRAHLEGFYYKPRLDVELLREHREGLILLTGCLNGDIPRALLANQWEGARALLENFQTLLGKENVFLELQDHPQLMEQRILNDRLLQLARSTGAPLVATNDCHCIEPQDREAHDVLLCIQTGAHVAEEDRFKMEGDFYMRSPEEMRRAFAHVPEAIDNTLWIAEQCALTLPLGKKHILPVFETPFQKPPEQYLRELCEEGFTQRYGATPPVEARERLDYELALVHKMDFDAYFLIVHDFVSFAKNSRILVGPGRGSAAGSIIAYCLRITDIDPLRYGLLFERFLNPERVSMPDIDIDFADTRREEVLNYVIEKYGKDHVAQIITFGTMAARAAVRDVGRALGMPYSEVDAIAKLIPGRPGIRLAEAIEHEPDLREHYASSSEVKKLLDLALKLEGVVRHASVHACAVVISDKPLIHYTPLQTPPGGQEAIITQYEMHAIESIGLLKMDFLGLKNLTILQYALEIVQRTKGQTIDLDHLPLDDAPTFDLMSRGETTGVFQFESAGMRRYLRELKPTRFEDLIAMNALYRPGPMEWIPAYIRGKHNEKSVHYLHPSFESILKETYGVAVYQEQILMLSQWVAGFSLGEADILRKAVGKKNPELLAQQRTQFIKGAKAKGHTEAFAKKVFEEVIEPFAGYGFNKAHATCYAMIAYRTAYLKSHYPAEFMAALMTSDQDNTDRIVIEINECEAMGIQVLPPSINESMAHFTVVNDQAIRFGLAAIKGVGIGTIREIMSTRDKEGAFKSIEDFARRVPYGLFNKKTLEALAYSGALDGLGERKATVASIDDIARYARSVQQHSNQGQTDLFSFLGPDEPNVPPFQLAKVTPASSLQRLSWEKQYLGLYVSGHPLQGLTKYLKKKVTLLNALQRRQVGRVITVAGLLSQVRRVTTKSGSPMAYLTLEDPTGRLEVTVFSKPYLQYRGLLTEDTVVVLTGKLELRSNALQLLCQSAQTVSLETMISKAKQAKLYDPDERVRLTSAVLQEDDEASDVLHGDEVEFSDGALPAKAFFSPSLPDPAPPTEDPLIVRLNDSSPSTEVLKSLKAILTRYPGTRPVEIHIPALDRLKRIKVPFGVQLNETLEREIAPFAQLAPSQ